MFTNLMLKFTLDVSSIIMLLILLCLIGLMALGFFKRKKVDAKLQEMRGELKVGDKVMTDTGIIGVIVNKRTQDEYNFVTIKTGDDKHEGYLEVFQDAIYYTFNKNDEPDFAGQNAEENNDKEEK